ncbi:lysophospholipid acyltransferase family protein [Chromobacterium haemolyticum]|uniref:hypothetical protein n=1 Tax=Chromobacterium haemolyticum TaxID=394935 RepID=UPI0005BE21E3|nr:hypothetical protein [Chromobacterium haemolyticum]
MENLNAISSTSPAYAMPVGVKFSDLMGLIPRWAWFGGKWSYPLQMVLAVLVGSAWTLKALTNTGKASLTLSAISHVMSVSYFRSWQVYWKIQINHARNTLTFSTLCRLPGDQLLRWGRKHTHVDIQVPKGTPPEKPVIYLLVSFALHYFGMLLPVQQQYANARKIAVVQPRRALEPLQKIGFYPFLSTMTGQKIEGIAADQPLVARQIARAVRQGYSVAMRVDSMPTETVRMVGSRLCGKAAMFPLSILELAKRLEADLVVLSVVRERGVFRTASHLRLSVPSQSSGEELAELACRIDGAIGALIARYPEQYTAWPAVAERWRLAQEIEQALSDGGEYGAA